MALDKSNFTDGSTPVHEAARVGNIQIFDYLVKVIKKRNEIIESLLDSYRNKSLNESIMKQLKEAKSLSEVLEFTDNSNMTPILVAVSEN